jgi:hypothetical protein
MRTLVLLAALAATPAIAGPTMPESLQSSWCPNKLSPPGFYDQSCDEPPNDGKPDPVPVEVTAEGVNSPLGNNCSVRSVTPFDVCPWGARYKDRKRELVLV